MKTLAVVLWAFLLLPSVSGEELETYSSRGNPKTLGVDFSIGRPKQWQARPPNSPAVIAAFWVTPDAVCDSMSLVVPQNQNLHKRDVTKEEFRPFFEHPDLEKMVGRMLPGATFVQKRHLPDFKFPAGFLDYTMTLKLPAGEQRFRVRNYIVYLGKVMLQVQFYLVQDSGPNRLAIFAEEMEQIINSLEKLPAD